VNWGDGVLSGTGQAPPGDTRVVRLRSAAGGRVRWSVRYGRYTSTP
jgi:hypothetical protein